MLKCAKCGDSSTDTLFIKTSGENNLCLLRSKVNVSTEIFHLCAKCYKKNQNKSIKQLKSEYNKSIEIKQAKKNIKDVEDIELARKMLGINNEKLLSD